MKKILLIIFFFWNFAFYNTLNANLENKIIVKVGKEIITSLDIKNKILANLVLSNNEINQENINKMKSIALNELINLRLKEQEIGGAITEVDIRKVDDYLNQISKNNIEKLKSRFKENDISFDSFIKEIKVEIKWQELIFKKYSKKIENNRELILNEIDEIIESDLVNKEVNLSEIQILKNDNISDEEIVSNILNEIKNNSFEKAANKFNNSERSSNNGNLGWINIKALSEKIYKIISKMKPGEISEPIIQSDTILILKLNEERKVSLNNEDKKKLKEDIIIKKQNEIFNLYSMSHISLMKNKHLIEYR